ncbi:hypothetical protein ABH926_002098 [Catenulispora sp. GP43]|uniref:hypothetical protein n=1 Tax=Catenulispora sp. GP43 TaxID=3156263 RepID=UPI0035178EFE
MRLTGRDETATEAAVETAAEAAAETADALACFEAGLAAGLDPQPAAGTAAGADGTAVTSTSSWWSGLVCHSCGHTFRRGDKVRPAPGRSTPVHVDPALRCGSADAAADRRQPVDDPTPGEFAAGLTEAWPPQDGVPAVRLEPDDWHVANGDRRGRPVVCLYCAHTFRAGEYVILCPCRSSRGSTSSAGEGCGAAVHRDPAAGLPCWENWCPDGTVTVCPVQLNALGDQGR